MYCNWFTSALRQWLVWWLYHAYRIDCSRAPRNCRGWSVPGSWHNHLLIIYDYFSYYIDLNICYNRIYNKCGEDNLCSLIWPSEMCFDFVIVQLTQMYFMAIRWIHATRQSLSRTYIIWRLFANLKFITKININRK